MFTKIMIKEVKPYPRFTKSTVDKKNIDSKTNNFCMVVTGMELHSSKSNFSPTHLSTPNALNSISVVLVNF